MNARRLIVPVLRASILVAGSLVSADASAQSAPRPQLYAVRNVRLSAAPDALKLTLILRDGRIAAIQDGDKEPPADARVIDGAGLIALPAFIDSYSFAGIATPTPVAERDVAPKPGSDVLVDMREADRKGVEPSVRAADLFKLDAETAKRYRSSGFGALLSAPHGELLAGESMLASTRDAAARDVALLPIVFDHAGFEAPGPGYPGTLMGAVAQLRQFFLDALHYREIERRRAAGKNSTRLPYDADLAAIQPALEKQRRIVCEAQGADDIERWIKLADEFGLEIAISGGREAWKRAALLSARKIPVLLTLDWGDEVEDPHAKDKKPESEKKPDAARPDGKPEAGKPDATKPGAAESSATQPAANRPEEKKADEKKSGEKKPEHGALDALDERAGGRDSTRDATVVAAIEANATRAVTKAAAVDADGLRADERRTDATIAGSEAARSDSSLDSAATPAQKPNDAGGNPAPASSPTPSTSPQSADAKTATPANPPAQVAPKPEEKKPDEKGKAAGGEPSPKPALAPDSAAANKSTPSENANGRDVEWIYEEPMRIREDKRRQWEETRNCALRLSEANVAFVFGSGKLTPKEVLDHVHALVENGLPADVAQRALTSDAAALLGVSKSLGKIEPGFDATMALWTKHPLTAKDAKLAWIFVDGFPYEFDLKANDLQGKPDEGVDVTGSWAFEFDTPEAKPAVADLKMSKDGGVKGTVRYRSPVDDKESSGEFEGKVAGKKIKLTGKVKIGTFESQVEIDGEIQGDSMTGTTAWKFSGSEDSRKFKATRKPKSGGDER
jgi:imidazolonepropionase-like amidohydrolase